MLHHLLTICNYYIFYTDYLIKINRDRLNCEAVSGLSLGLVGDGSFVQLMQVVPHADGQPVAQLAAVHGVHHPEHLPPGEGQPHGGVRLVVKMGPHVEVVAQAGLEDLLVDCTDEARG